MTSLIGTSHIGAMAAVIGTHHIGAVTTVTSHWCRDQNDRHKSRLCCDKCRQMSHWCQEKCNGCHICAKKSVMDVTLVPLKVSQTNVTLVL